MTFKLAKDLYDLGEMKEEIYIQYLAEEMARQRTLKGINRVAINNKYLTK